LEGFYGDFFAVFYGRFFGFLWTIFEYVHLASLARGKVEREGGDAILKYRKER